jgi:hypothetical protein
MSLTATVPVTDAFGLELSTDPVAAAAYRRAARLRSLVADLVPAWTA